MKENMEQVKLLTDVMIMDFRMDSRLALQWAINLSEQTRAHLSAEELSNLELIKQNYNSILEYLED